MSDLDRERRAKARALRVLVLNPGSSSLKASIIETPRRDAIARMTIAWAADATRSADRTSAISSVLRAVEAAGIATSSIDAVGYRVVHGGTRYVGPVLLDDATLEAIEDLAELAPLHNRVAVETIRAARHALPDVPHVAAFDTAFHAGLPAAGYRYPVPTKWFEDWGIRRYGFHGLSVAWSVARASELLDLPASELRLVVAHLGSGCSVTAVDRGGPVDTSMGMTPLEGLMMGTRAGSVDPGILLALLRDGRLSVAELADALDHRSGLLGVSGRSPDARELLAVEATGDEAAGLALEMFTRRAAAGIAAAATCLPSLDAIVFTGGIGENSAVIRARIAGRLATLDVPLIPAGDGADDRVLATGSGGLAVLRIESREDIVIAEAVVEVVGS